MNQEEIAKQLAEKTGTMTYAEEQKALNKEFSNYDCLLCKLVSGTVLFGFGSLNIMRLSEGLFFTLPMKQRIFQVVGTGSIFLFSFSQFYIMYDLMRKRKMKQNPLERLVEPLGFFGRIRRNFSLISKEDHREEILTKIKQEEAKNEESSRLPEKSID